MVGVHCFLSWGKPGDQSDEMGEASWERDLRGCWGQREYRSWTVVHTRTGSNSKEEEFQKKWIYFYLLRIPFHCMSRIWRKDRREKGKQKATFASMLLDSGISGMRIRCGVGKMGSKPVLWHLLAVGKPLNMPKTSFLMGKMWLIISILKTAMQIKWNNHCEHI